LAVSDAGAEGDTFGIETIFEPAPLAASSAAFSLPAASRACLASQQKVSEGLLSAHAVLANRHRKRAAVVRVMKPHNFGVNDEGPVTDLFQAWQGIQRGVALG
jgi:hypothetical protein